MKMPFAGAKRIFSFTLLEIMIVLSMGAVVMAFVSYQGYSIWTTNQRKSALHQLEEHLRDIVEKGQFLKGSEPVKLMRAKRGIEITFQNQTRMITGVRLVEKEHEFEVTRVCKAALHDNFVVECGKVKGIKVAIHSDCYPPVVIKQPG